jgi:WS/DGAT/MGAT family acyltransferase
MDRAMTASGRLSGLDASFLALEKGGAHMHVASCMVFRGPAPSYEAFLAHLEPRLPLVPRYRQKLAFPPLGLGRPVWVDDPHFNLRYHVRHTALPAPAGPEQLRRLAGRLLSQRLDRAKPLWELWLVERVEEDRFALIAKTHHALVDGISGMDITAILLDREPDPGGPAPVPPWVAEPEPSGAALLADALQGAADVPLHAARLAGELAARPREALTRAASAAAGLAALGRAGLGAAPASPLNLPVGPQRRFTWVEAELDRFRAIKDRLGGTVNDVVLAAVAGALRALLVSRGEPVSGVTLAALVPVSVRASEEHGALGNRVAALSVPLPVWEPDPAARLRSVHAATAGLRESGRAVSAQALTRLAGFAPPTLLAQASRLQARQRLFNLTVTNVPGPQQPLYLLGRRLDAIYPQVPLAANAALGVAVTSYAGRMDFGLLGEYDAMPDLEAFAAHLEVAVEELALAAGLEAQPHGNGRVREVARALRS